MQKKRLVEEITVTEPVDADDNMAAPAVAAADEPRKKKKKKSKGQAEDDEAQAATNTLLGDVLQVGDCFISIQTMLVSVHSCRVSLNLPVQMQLAHSRQVTSNQQG